MSTPTEFSLEELRDMITKKLAEQKKEGSKIISAKSGVPPPKPIASAQTNQRHTNLGLDDDLSHMEDDTWQKSSTKAILRRRLGISVDLD